MSVGGAGAHRVILHLERGAVSCRLVKPSGSLRAVEVFLHLFGADFAVGFTPTAEAGGREPQGLLNGKGFTFSGHLNYSPFCCFNHVSKSG